MHTQCVECGTVFQITAEQLAVCHGTVRCGSCGSVFSALQALCEDLDESGEIPTCFHSERPPTLPNPADEEPMIDDLFSKLERPDFIRHQEDERGEDIAASTHPDIPPPAGTGRLPGRTIETLWRSAAISLFFILTAQVVWQQKNALQQSDTWRPWLERVCAIADCEVPMRENLEAIRLVSRSIRPHPSVASALMISATMQNQAGFVQPYPVIEIVLSDLSGRRVAMRRFKPDEYMDDPRKFASGIPSGTLFPLVFEVVDPGDDAVAFEFSFR